MGISVLLCARAYFYKDKESNMSQLYKATGRYLVWVCFVFPVSISSFAENFGIYDSRGLAMGGTSVAAANNHQAQYYNPALLGLHDVDEDDAEDGRFVFPNIVLQIAGPVEEVGEAVNDDIDDQLKNAVSTYNQQQTSENAAVVASFTREVENVIQELNEDDLLADTYFGLSVSEPSLAEGGAFHFGVRAFSVGVANIDPEDLVLLDRYIDAIDLLAAGGSPDDLPQDLVNEAGELIDPSDRLNSTADLGAIVIGEWAISMAKAFDVFGQSISLGVTPKLMQVEAFRDSTNFGQDDISFSDSQSSHLSMNLDVGVAIEFLDYYRVGFAIKDAIPHDFEVKNDAPIELRPRSRLGLAYVSDYLTIGVDVDIEENAPIASEVATQEASLGLEWSPINNLDLRLGYRHDMTALQSAVISTGIGYNLGGFSIEASYAESEELTGASMQMGWSF